LFTACLNDGALNINSNQAIAQQQQLQTNNTIRVDAGGGNSTAPLTVFVPQNIEIKAGQTINWYNPTPIGEPHSVTFLQDSSSLFPPFAAPFAVPNSTEFKALIPSPNVEPLIVPNPPGTEPATTKTVIIDNARAYNPVVIDSTGKT
jgi:plastocyanin